MYLLLNTSYKCIYGCIIIGMLYFFMVFISLLTGELQNNPFTIDKNDQNKSNVEEKHKQLIVLYSNKI